jgi:RNA polymerase sigma factor (sigma-70 family)
VARDKEQVSCELLVVRCRLGERAAWEQLVREWEPKLLYFVRRLVGGESDALDVLQQTWLKVLRKIGSLQDGVALAPWLYRIARNTALNHRRVQAAYRAAIAEERDEREEHANDEVAVFDDAEQVHFGLSRLSLTQREVLTLHFLEGWNVEQIAQVLGVPPGTVKSRLFHARNALRKVLSEDIAKCPTPRITSLSN